MSAEIPTTEPTEITAGNTLQWTKTLDDYSAADSWVLSYYLRGAKSITVSTTASGSDHAVSVSAATTALWPAGNYEWFAFVAKAGERFQVGSGRVDVLPDIATVTNTYDVRTQTERILQAHLDAYESRASRPEQSYSIQAMGRQFTYYSLTELLKAIDYWKAKCEKETNPTATGKNIFVRFNNP